MGKRNIIGRGMTQNMERIMRGQMGEERNRKQRAVVKERTKAGRGKRR
jgi:hypothetical protein